MELILWPVKCCFHIMTWPSNRVQLLFVLLTRALEYYMNSAETNTMQTQSQMLHQPEILHDLGVLFLLDDT